MKNVFLAHFWPSLAILALSTGGCAWGMNEEVFEPTGLRYSDPHWSELDHAKKNIDFAKYPDPANEGVTRAIIQADIPKIKKFFGPGGTFAIDQASILEGNTSRSDLRFYYPLQYALKWLASEKVLIELVKLGAPIKNYKGYDPQLSPELFTKLQNHVPRVANQTQHPQLPHPPLVSPQQPSEPIAPPKAIPQPQLSWRQTISAWCKQSKSGYAKTGACFFALAAVAVVTKLLYNNFLAKKTQAPAQIMITNESGTTVKLLYLEINVNESTSITLKPGEEWPLDMNKIKLDLIITEEQAIKRPLPIDLKRYKISEYQQRKILHITIHKNSGLWYLWTGIPYTYTATWQ